MSDLAAGARQDNVGRGIFFALVAILIFSSQDAMSKFLVQSVSPFQMTMMRFWAFGAFSLFLALRKGSLTAALRTRQPLWQVLRGLLLITDIWMYVLSLRTVPLAAVQSITLVYPLLVTLFAIPLLGEKVGVFRLVAVTVGFLGALIIVRPGGVPLDWGVGYAIGSGASTHSISCLPARCRRPTAQRPAWSMSVQWACSSVPRSACSSGTRST